MPTAKDYVNALNYAVDNFDAEDPQAQAKSLAVAKKMEFSLPELKQIRWADANKENPENSKRAIGIKRVAFDRIADKLPAINERGVSLIERFNIKNLIDENLPLQKSYLERKGYKVRQSGDQLEVKKADDLVYRPIDPKGFDPMDVLDLTWDVIKGTIETFGMGAKAAGLVAAPATAGASIAAAGALGAGLGLGTEYARQAAGKALGLRDKPDFPLMASEAAWGAGTSSTLKGLGLAAAKYGAAEKAAALSKQGWRKGAEILESSWETLGAKATPALKFANEQIRKLEDAIVKQPSRFFKKTRELSQQYQDMARVWGEGLMESLESASQDLFKLPIRQVEEAPEMIGKAADKVAAGVLNTIIGAKEGAEAKLIPVVGADIRKTIIDKLQPKLAKAKELYDEVDAALAGNELVPRKQQIYATIKSMRPSEIKTGINSALNDWLDMAKQAVDEVSTVKGLDELSTSLLDAIEGGSKNIRAAAKNIRGSVLDARAKTYSDTILDLAKRSKESADPIAKKAAAYWEDVFLKRKQADRLYAELNNDITSLVNRPGAQSSRAFSAAEKLDKLAKTAPEEIFQKVAATDDAEKMKWIADKFPDEYRQVVGQQLGKIWLEVAQTSKDIRKVVLKEFNRLTDSQKLAMMGENANVKITDLADIVNKADNKIAVAEWLNDIQKKVKLDDEFTANVVNQLKQKSKAELATIFGADALEKVKAIINIGSFRKTIVGPSGTPDALRYFKPSWYGKKFSEIKNEYDLLREYKREVLQPETAGKTYMKIGEKLQKPKTFAGTEAIRKPIVETAREILITPDKGENK